MQFEVITASVADVSKGNQVENIFHVMSLRFCQHTWVPTQIQMKHLAPKDIILVLLMCSQTHILSWKFISWWVTSAKAVHMCLNNTKCTLFYTSHAGFHNL